MTTAVTARCSTSVYVPLSLLAQTAPLSAAEAASRVAEAAAALDERWALLEDACAFVYRLSAGMPLYRPHDDFGDAAAFAELAEHVRADELPLLQTQNPHLLAHVNRRLAEHAADAAVAATAEAGSDGSSFSAEAAAGAVSASTGGGGQAGAGGAALPAPPLWCSALAQLRPPISHRLRHALGIRALIPELGRGWSGAGTGDGRTDAAAIRASVADAVVRARLYCERHAAALAPVPASASASALPAAGGPAPAAAAAAAAAPPALARKRRRAGAACK